MMFVTNSSMARFAAKTASKPVWCSSRKFVVASARADSALKSLRKRSVVSTGIDAKLPSPASQFNLFVRRSQGHRGKTAPMDGAGAMPVQRGEMRGGAVTLVFRETILRMDGIHFFHDAIPGYLRDHAGG